MLAKKKKWNDGEATYRQKSLSNSNLGKDSDLDYVQQEGTKTQDSLMVIFVEGTGLLTVL